MWRGIFFLHSEIWEIIGGTKQAVTDMAHSRTPMVPRHCISWLCSNSGEARSDDVFAHVRPSSTFVGAGRKALWTPARRHGAPPARVEGRITGAPVGDGCELCFCLFFYLVRFWSVVASSPQFCSIVSRSGSIRFILSLLFGSRFVIYLWVWLDFDRVSNRGRQSCLTEYMLYPILLRWTNTCCNSIKHWERPVNAGREGQTKNLPQRKFWLNYIIIYYIGGGKEAENREERPIFFSSCRAVSDFLFWLRKRFIIWVPPYPHK
jgi:hypothetical protein